MLVSVIIPTYNSSKTIGDTLNSVLRQSEEPAEILILDDGSTDDTLSILNSYRPRVMILQQDNRGVASARNGLCERCVGDLIAFLDHDDIWHPDYLKIQKAVYQKYPNAVAFFAGHLNIFGYGSYQWSETRVDSEANVELIDPLSFFRRYNQATGSFGSMSYCCVPKRVVMQMGSEPFCVSGVDDSYFCNVLALIGHVVYTQVPLVAYRITKDAQSTNKLKALELWVEVFQRLEQRYRDLPDIRLSKAFRLAYASKRRQYAKRLMGAMKTSEARRQVLYSMTTTNNCWSITKSLILLLLTYLPAFLQPKWPPIHRTQEI